ncbi:MAG: diguanylate cyclase [Methylibium sp.]|uniref:EAL domain-containing protein n=1 Tax=Methylibium sp. TaxID=2067992 RepID=UPI0018333D33|nr:EAL domain-containing protein [Methylibium sp.]MBA2723575.1 diguanylate cyclase [Methylibium sp.]MBA3588332.1 diguanylate cyclase [Methylibium sp.]
MTNAPFGDCASAELHRADHIQSYGALVVIDKHSQLICACSANIHAFGGKPPAELLGASWSALFTAAQLPSLFAPIDEPGSDMPHLHETALGNRAVLLSQHSMNEVTLVEIEPLDAAASSQAQDKTLRSAAFERADYLNALSASTTAESAAKLLMTTVARITQFDRVMLYRFLPEWHGEVIAETLQSGVPGFLGLRFPATDLPENARRLYLRNGQRLIVDAYSEAVPVLTAAGCPPIDFTFSSLRAVHPVHIQYLKNIGAPASFSVSIVVASHLWGLIACHHLAPRKVALPQRLLCEELARIGSIHMSDMAAMQIEGARAAYREARAEVRGTLRTLDPRIDSINSQLTPIRKMFGAQGIWAHLDGRDTYGGDVPDDVSLSVLKNRLETFDRFGIAHSDRIDPSLAKYRPLVRFSSGLLFLPLVDQDFVLLMRSEQIEQVSWAGKPQALDDGPLDVQGLSPRASFQRWAQDVEGVAEPWQDVDIEAATKLREMLIELIERVQLESLALYDPLTGVANRNQFERKLREAILSSVRNDNLAAVYMLDLDRFKAVNDSMGHAAGDELLVEVSRRLKGIVRDRDVVARLGGDEFAIVQFQLERIEDADLVAGRILQAIRRPFHIRGQDVEIGVSIGIAFCPFHFAEEDQLLQGADLALYQAKHGGRNAFKVFSNDMLSEKEQKESVRMALEHALEGDGFSFVYQPIVAGKTRVLQSFEAFARWQHPDRGEICAAEFMPLIEQYQLAARFAQWGIREAVKQAKQWQRLGLALVPVSVNMTTRQFLGLDLVGLCSALAKEFNISLEWLRLDLEDAALLTDFQRVTEKMSALAGLNVLTNIDHFGQAPIVLKRLLGLRINQLKVPGQIFDKIDGTRRNAALAPVIRSIGKVLRVPVVATQIETATMEAQAVKAGIELLQGYSISRCLVPADAEAWLRINAGERLRASSA